MITFALVITFIFADGSTVQDKRVVEAPVCQNGVEDASCGVRYCLAAADRIAELLHPETTYLTQCLAKGEE